MSVTRRMKKSNTGCHAGRQPQRQTKGATITTRTKPHTLSADTSHCYITHLIEDGYDPLFVQQQVGHSYASTTALYTSVSSDFRNRTLRAALDRSIQAALSGGTARGEEER